MSRSLWRVALVVPGLSNGGGVATLALFLHRVLLASGRYQPDLISIAVSARDVTSVRLLQPASWPGGVRVTPGEWRGLPYTHVGAMWAELEFQRYRPRRALTALLEPYDLVQVVCGTPAAGFAARRLRKPTCIYLASTARHERASLLAGQLGWRRGWVWLMTVLNTSFERRALAAADHVFALSDYTLSLLAPSVAASRSSVALAGVDTAFFHPPSQRVPSGPILAVGRFADPRKNVRLLFEAYHCLRARQPDAPRLLLVGQRPRPVDWAVAEARGIAPWLDVMENVTAEELAAVYRRASLFVLSSNEEGLGFVVLEAMASGLPVVSTRCGGAESCIRDGQTGSLVPRGDSAALAGSMSVLLADPCLADRMGMAGRRLVEQDFSLEIRAQPFLDVYDRLLAQGVG